MKIREQHPLTNLDAIHGVAIELSKFEKSYDLADLTIYHFYCYSKCAHRNQEHFLVL